MKGHNHVNSCDYELGNMSKFKKKYSLHVSSQNVRLIPGSWVFCDTQEHLASDQRFIVLEGNRRDLRNNRSSLTTPRNFAELVSYLRFFPSYRDLRMLEQICAKIFVNSNEKDLKELIFLMNKIPKEFYDKIHGELAPNYLARDYFAFGAAGGIFDDKEDQLLAFNIGKPNIMALDDDGNITGKTEDCSYRDKLLRSCHIKAKYPKIVQKESNDDYRALLRREFRNNNSVVGCYSAFTGEESALKSVRMYSLDLLGSSHVIAYSSKYREFLDDKETRREIIRGKRVTPLEEGTIIHYQKVLK